MQARCTASRHGDTHTAYTTWGCRCPGAKRAGKLYRTAKANGTFQPKLVDALGARRRIQALMAMGWSQAQIGEHAGLKADRVSHIQHAPQLLRRTVDKIVKAYEELSGRVPPRTRAGTYARTYALNRGWVPPLAWDDIDDPDAVPQMPEDSGAVDQVAVERRLAGEKLDLNAAERAAVREIEQERLAASRAARERRRATVESAFERGLNVMDAAAASGMDRTAVLKIYKKLRAERGAA